MFLQYQPQQTLLILLLEPPPDLIIGNGKCKLNEGAMDVLAVILVDEFEL